MEMEWLLLFDLDGDAMGWEVRWVLRNSRVAGKKNTYGWMDGME